MKWDIAKSNIKIHVGAHIIFIAIPFLWEMFIFLFAFFSIK